MQTENNILLITKQYKTITSLVLHTFKEQPKIRSKALQEIVLEHFATSKFDVTHYSWYKNQIKKGRYAQQFTGQQLNNIFGNKLIYA